jgi:wobble nucleotide-excising tRNase
VDIRVYYQDGNDWKPTKKGITFKRELLDDVLKALTQLSESITEKSVK